MAETSGRVLGFIEITRLLRQQHPTVLVDRVLDHEPGEYLRSMLSVSGSMASVAGHLPWRAILPGTHLIHAAAQSGTIFFVLTTGPLSEDEHVFLGSVQSRFLRPVEVGDQVVFDVRSERLLGQTLFFSCRATVEERPVATLRATLVRATVGQPVRPS